MTKKSVAREDEGEEGLAMKGKGDIYCLMNALKWLVDLALPNEIR